MKKVLILGNGLSRLNYKDFIKNWDGDLWGCNRVFKEYFDLPKLDLIVGDLEALKEAVQHRIDYRLNYKIYSKERYPNKPEFEFINIPNKYIKDSGTTLVCKALLEDYEEIVVCGFDLGGKDIYVFNHERKDKTSWVITWRRIKKEFSFDKIKFLGNDKVVNFINSGLPAQEWKKNYMENKRITRSTKNKSVIILGNGISRLKNDQFINEWQHEIWGCNWFFRDCDKYGHRVTRIGTVHNDVAVKAIKYKIHNNLRYMIWTKPSFKESFNEENNIQYFGCDYGWSTGSLMLKQAMIEKYMRIYLIGFDFGGPDIYQPKPVVGSNFKNQFLEIIKEHGKKRFRFIGGTPNFIKKA